MSSSLTRRPPLHAPRSFRAPSFPRAQLRRGNANRAAGSEFRRRPRATFARSRNSVRSGTGDTGHLYSIADRDRTFRQDDQAANEIAGDVLQSEANPYADRAGENGERPQMNPGIVQHDENANDQDDVADDLRDGILQRAIQPAVYEESVKEE